jgi:hypothetical protein
MMRLFKTQTVQSLREWLEIATKRLSDAAKERIAVEIEAHHAESINGHLANGLSRTEAQAAALAELGDARTARKHFRQRHLTEFEAGCIKVIQLEARRKHYLLLKYGSFCLCVVPQVSAGRTAGTLAYIALGFIVLIALPTASYIISRRREAERYVRSLVLLSSVNGMTPAMAVVTILRPDFHGAVFVWSSVAGRVFDSAFFFLVVLLSLRVIRLWRKLKSVSEPWNQLTPADIAPPPSFIDFIRGR